MPRTIAIGCVCMCAVGIFSGCTKASIPKAISVATVNEENASVVSGRPTSLFSAINPASIGISFVHQTLGRHDYFLPEIIGSGCALVDVDGDDRVDILAASLSSTDGTAGAQPIGGTVEIFFQNTNGTFSKRDNSTLVIAGLAMGIAAGDLTNDGLPELLVTSYGEDSLFLNEGEGRFRNVTSESGYSNPAWGASASFVDFDRDGWLDLFVTNYIDYTARPCRQLGGGNPDFCVPHLFPGTIDRLFRNTSHEAMSDETPRQVRLEDCTAESGLAGMKGAGLGVAAADFTADGWPDLYVANDQMANFLWVNQRNGSFREEAVLRGCAYDRQGRSQASMGVAFDDFDGDGLWDLFLTHLEGEYHTLYRGHAGGLFEDDTHAAGLADVTLPYTGFGTGSFDIEHDGDVDIVCVNGRVRRPAGFPAQSAAYFSPYRQRGQVLVNRGGVFQEQNPKEEPWLEEQAVARGLAVGDLDRDGDLDLVVNRIGEPLGIYRNDSVKTGHSVRVRAVLPQCGGRDAIGAVITLVTDRGVFRRLIQPGLSYLSSHEPWAHFGTGAADAVREFQVLWPDGSTSLHPGGDVDREYILEKP